MLAAGLFPMHVRRIFVTVAALVVLAVAGLALWRNSLEPARHVQPVAASPARAPIDPQTAPAAMGTVSVSGTAAIALEAPARLTPEQRAVRNYREAPTAGDAYAAIESLWAAGLDREAAWAETQLAHACESAADPSPPGIVKASWAWDVLAEYCSGWDPSMIERAKQWHLDHRSSDPTTGLKQRLKDMAPEEQREFVLEFVRAARTPDDVRAALDALYQASHPARALTDLGQDSDMALEDFHGVLGNAIVLTQCRMFGGCGPGGTEFLQRCARSGSCRPGADMGSFIAYNTSPYQMEQTLLVMRDILAYMEQP